MSSRITLPPRPPAELLAQCPPAVLAYIEALERVLEQVIKRQEEQEQALREAKRQATPFRRGKKKQKRKKPGRKGGHSPSRRDAARHVDEEHDVAHPKKCPDCGGEMEEVDCYEQTQEDIEVRKVVRAFTVHIGCCRNCGATAEGHHEWQTSRARGAAGHHIGPRALALAAELHYGQGVPFDKVAEHLAHLGLSVEESTLVRAMQRVALRGAETRRFRHCSTKCCRKTSSTSTRPAGRSTGSRIICGS